MTHEHRLLIGLGDIQGIVLECTREGCGSRSIIPTKNIDDCLPDMCPKGHRWNWRDSEQFVGSPFKLWIGLLKRMADSMAPDPGFRILLELDDPS